MKAIIVDLDGTLCDVDHRVHHVRKEEKDWHSFNEAMSEDKINLWCHELIKSMRNENFEILFVTGRDENYRTHTEKWLADHKVEYDQLYMRKADDFRADELIKKEIFLNEIKPNKEVIFVVDDRLSVVKMWREIGMVCLQCDWGDF